MVGWDAVGKIAPWLVIGGGVTFAIYSVFQYLDAGIRGAENTYKYWVGEIAVELKDFYAQNKALGINGLTPEQEALIQTKEGYLQDAYESYLDQLESRNLPVDNYIELAITSGLALGGLGLFLKYGGLNIFKNKTEPTPEAKPKEMGKNTIATTNMIIQAVAYEFAYSGATGTASMIQLSLDRMYTTHFEPALTQQISNFTTQLQFLTPGTLEYARTYNMLNAAQYCLTMQSLPKFNMLVALPII